MDLMETRAAPSTTLRDIPSWAWAVLVLLIASVYVTGYDQGLLLRVFLGDLAETNNHLHEFFHDGRHLLGFPCH